MHEWLYLEDMRGNVENKLRMLKYGGIDGDNKFITNAQSMGIDQFDKANELREITILISFVETS